MKYLVFFASGSGTNFQSVIDVLRKEPCGIEIRGLITNNPEAGACERAQKNDIPVRVLKPSLFENKEGFERAMLQTLQKWQPDLIVLAGYLLRIPASVISRYPEQIINIHPSLLPKYGGKGFYGSRVHQAVLEAGESTTGCTVHLVDEEYDRGRVLGQRSVPVLESDTVRSLAKRVLKEEHQLLPKVIKKYLIS